MILAFITAKLFLLKAFELLVLPAIAVILLKNPECVHVVYVCVSACSDYAINYSAYTGAGVSSSSFFMQMYRGYQVVRVANTANALLNIPMERFSMQFLKEVYNWLPWNRGTMNYSNASGLSLQKFPNLANKYLHPKCDKSINILFDTLAYQKEVGSKHVALIPLNIDRKALLEDTIAIVNHHGNTHCLLKMCGKSEMVGQHGDDMMAAGIAVIKALS